MQRRGSVVQIVEITEQDERVAPRQPRTNMFVLATIYADTGSAPARVRNLSPTGALI